MNNKTTRVVNYDPRMAVLANSLTNDADPTHVVALALNLAEVICEINSGFTKAPPKDFTPADVIMSVLENLNEIVSSQGDPAKLDRASRASLRAIAYARACKAAPQKPLDPGADIKATKAAADLMARVKSL